MADHDSTQAVAGERHTFTFDATGGLYALSGGADRGDCLDQLTARIGQLRALLAVVCGEGFEPFDGMSEKIKHEYLWACSMLANECSELVDMQFAEAAGGKSA